MPIFLVTGLPRSGKSYYSVDKISRLLMDAHKNEKNVLIVTNIEGLHIENPLLINRDFETSDFSNRVMGPYIEGLREEYGLSRDDKIYFFIDEAQRYFPPSLRDTDVIYFFDYHAHYYIDIFLVAQHNKKLSNQITCNAEYEFRAVSNMVNPLPTFRYNVFHQGEKCETKNLKKSQAIFALYKSQHGGKPPRKNRRLLYFVLFMAVVFIGGVFLIRWRIKEGFNVDAYLPKKALIQTPAIDKNMQQIAPSRFGEEVEYKEPEFIAPLPLSYNVVDDTLTYEDPKLGKVKCSVSSYVKKYTPFLYGYGYVHIPGEKLILTSALTRSILFPDRYELPQTSRPADRLSRIHTGENESEKAGLARYNGQTEFDGKVARYLYLKGQKSDMHTERLSAHEEVELKTLDQYFHDLAG